MTRDKEEWMLISVMLSSLLITVILFWTLVTTRAKGAELALPPEIVFGQSRPPLNVFGTYSTNYMRKRWHKMCRGAARYDAMREAYALHKPDPCNGAKEWAR